MMYCNLSVYRTLRDAVAVFLTGCCNITELAHNQHMSPEKLFLLQLMNEGKKATEDIQVE